MPRRKNYDEHLVIEKAMHLFWSNGFNNTSARMLEKEMGINLFSIYASFKNKDGVLLASIKPYKRKLRKELLQSLSSGPLTIESLKKYFYDFLQFTKEEKRYRGCLLINTVNELGAQMDTAIAKEIESFSNELMATFKNILSKDQSKSETLIQQEANYLFVALQGIALCAKSIEENQIEDYIEMTFKKI